MAYTLVDNALQNFLEQRHSAEVSSIAETIAILESHASELREQIDTADGGPQAEPRQREPRQRARGHGPPPRRDPAQEALRTRAAEVKVLLEAKRRAIKELDDFRRRRLAELQAELAQKRAVYADAHPAVAQLLQSIGALQEKLAAAGGAPQGGAGASGPSTSKLSQRRSEAARPEATGR